MSEASAAVYLGRLPDVRMSFQLMGLHARRAEAGWTYPSHEHPMYEIHWMVDGDMEMVINGQTYPQSRGDLLFIRPGMTHFCKSAGPEGFAYFSVHFSLQDTTLSRELNRYKDSYYPAASSLVQGLTPALSALYRLAIEHMKSPLPASGQMKVHAAVFELLGALVDQLSQTDAIALSRKEMLARRIAEQIEDSVRYLLLHGPMQGSERTWIQDIAKSLGLSPSQVNRIFHQVYGKAPRRFMSDTFLNEARRLLLQTDLSIDHIAMMLGYKTNAHFSRQFKRWTGIAPSEFRSHGNAEDT
ncbi:helix-turn-helix transcriptional regulator [Paenibacillus mucilaginosus]|uniref:Transcriptional regulator, AraC family n=1 Tax=Paenibacillus mucilaginosus (strain KNP414) TaxID=1036673 RepID=F8FRV0_PAEMK|nr:AraC family transcriptional regulator [Paenibacillus mucilaginosus]AEI40657.1 transcriptional regulator, AraC family [Paenibacillus mucilaginosus KNP414]MCG7211857.1 AraC family transcriptional regulator [Paenibacillus mucilaginosus]WDM29794.1 AraC family transcriptional regulator [Paenibacillus mucilaginosus]